MFWGDVFPESQAVAFRLKAILNLDHLGVLFQELRVEDSRCFDEVSRLLFITPHLRIGVDPISYLCIVAQKQPTPILSQLNLTPAGLE